jgi:hypothetical protein
MCEAVTDHLVRAVAAVCRHCPPEALLPALEIRVIARPAVKASLDTSKRFVDGSKPAVSDGGGRSGGFKDSGALGPVVESSGLTGRFGAMFRGI